LFVLLVITLPKPHLRNAFKVEALPRGAHIPANPFRRLISKFFLPFTTS